MAKMKMKFGGKEVEVDDMVEHNPNKLRDVKPLPLPKSTTPEKIKKYSTPPKDKQSESSKQEQENERLDKKQEDEYKKYQEGEKTRLKDQGSSFFSKGGKVSSASKRADGCATKGKTKGRVL